MNVLSLFDGMSGGRLALATAGINPTKYYASEVDKFAIKVSSNNWTDVEQLGCVTNWRSWPIDWSSIDLLIGGSPCQGFSLAGKQQAFSDPRSMLFFTYVDILIHIKQRNPNVRFMLENVKMKAEFLQTISDMLGVSWEFINSSDFSPCERPRHYWFNWHYSPPKSLSGASFMDLITDDLIPMSEGWLEWWAKNSEFQLKKSYSRLHPSKERKKGITMTTRQYASWNGNFIKYNGTIHKPGKKSLALLVGASENYFDSVSQRAAEELTGNGWANEVIVHLLKCLLTEVNNSG